MKNYLIIRRIRYFIDGVPQSTTTYYHSHNTNYPIFTNNIEKANILQSKEEANKIIHYINMHNESNIDIIEYIPNNEIEK